MPVTLLGHLSTCLELLGLPEGLQPLRLLAVQHPAGHVPFEALVRELRGQLRNLGGGAGRGHSLEPLVLLPRHPPQHHPGQITAVGESQQSSVWQESWSSAHYLRVTLKQAEYLPDSQFSQL